MSRRLTRRKNLLESLLQARKPTGFAILDELVSLVVSHEQKRPAEEFVVPTRSQRVSVIRTIREHCPHLQINKVYPVSRAPVGVVVKTALYRLTDPQALAAAQSEQYTAYVTFINRRSRKVRGQRTWVRLKVTFGLKNMRRVTIPNTSAISIVGPRGLDLSKEVLISLANTTRRILRGGISPMYALSPIESLFQKRRDDMELIA